MPFNNPISVESLPADVATARRLNNKDKVTSPVRNQATAYAGIGLLISFLLRSLLDWQVDPAEAEMWWNGLSSILVPLIPAALGVFGAIRGAWQAREKVTPTSDPMVLNEDTQRLERLIPQSEVTRQVAQARKDPIHPMRPVGDPPTPRRPRGEHL